MVVDFLVQNGDTLVKLKSLASTPGCSIAVPVNDALRTGSVNPSMFLKRSRRLWLNLRFLTGLLISPCSTRKVPSLVMPVRVFVRGSTSRMYHSLVNNSPLSISPTSSSVVLVAPFPLMTRFVGASPSGFGRGSSCPVGLTPSYL